MSVQAERVVNTTRPSFVSKHGQKLGAAAFWILLLGGYAWYYRANGLTTETALLQIGSNSPPRGGLCSHPIHALRPLLFFSAALLTIASGAILGRGSASLAGCSLHHHRRQHFGHRGLLCRALLWSGLAVD